MPEPYAATRLDAIRRLHGEDYAIVTRTAYERIRAWCDVNGWPPPDWQPGDEIRPLGLRRPILCAHADQNGEGAHWKLEGEPCPLSTEGSG